MKKRSLNITTSFGTDLPHTVGSSQQIQQVFINLISNASDAMKGDGKLTLVTSTMDASAVLEMSGVDGTQCARSDTDFKAICAEYGQFLACHCVDRSGYGTRGAEEHLQFILHDETLGEGDRSGTFDIENHN